MIFKLIVSKIVGLISQADRILLVGHQKPDGDALGAICALSLYLKEQKKQYQIYCADLPANQYAFLPSIEEVKNDLNQAIKFNPDLIIVLDTSDLKHAGLKEYITASPKIPIINIDHHITNENFGQVNLVDPGAVATSEIVFKIFLELNHDITKSMATCLLTGIFYDTTNFFNPNTTLASLQVASKLLRRGARLPQVNDFTLKNKDLPTLQLWGRILARLKYNTTINVATTIVTMQDLKDYQVEPDVTDGLSNFLNSLSGVTASIILKEQEDGTIKGSMRTNNDFIDLSKLAKILGGGGHRKAAGFTVKGKLQETEDGWKII